MFHCLNFVSIFVLKKCDKSQLTEEQSRLVDKHVIEGHLNAIEAKPRYRSIHQFKTIRLTQKMAQFRIRVEVRKLKSTLTMKILQCLRFSLEFFVVLIQMLEMCFELILGCQISVLCNARWSVHGCRLSSIVATNDEPCRVSCRYLLFSPLSSC